MFSYLNRFFKQLKKPTHTPNIALIFSIKGLFMLGRSDGTLNPNGVRFGSAEIYNIVECFTEVADSLCVGQKSPVDGEERVILFLKVSMYDTKSL